MALQLGVSTSMLYKSFIAILAIPPLTYIHQQKVLYAQRMLAHGKSVTMIADDPGYSSTYHLSKTFKQITGSVHVNIRKILSYYKHIRKCICF
ncbi:MAG: helix-turn-helix domain-containing protein [Thomasclavelia ramosa]